MNPTYAVVPSPGRDCLEGCLTSLLPQVDLLFLIRTEEFGIPTEQDAGKIVTIDVPNTLPKNISHWWNLGIQSAAAHARMLGQGQWNVLIVNDDVVACPQLSGALDGAMRSTTAAVAYPDNFSGDRCVLHTEPGPVELSTRMSGWCFMLRGERDQRADEQFEWHFGDDDLDWQARTMGGALMVPGCAVEHLYPNQSTERSAELSARTHVDRCLFDAKWNGVPH